MSSLKSAPDMMLRPENCATKTVSGPISRMLSRSDSSKPRMSDVMPTMAVMPMTMPRMVSPDRIFWVRMVVTAITTIS